MATTPKPDTGRYAVIKFFNKPIVDKILALVNYDQLTNGLDSLNNSIKKQDTATVRKLKNNREFTGKAFSDKVFEIKQPEVFSMPWVEFTYPKRISNIIYSSMKKGGYYRPHLDGENLGHFSTTIFLAHPNTYKGGELELYLNGELKEFKLRPGYGVVYETGIPHQVKEVISGERKVLCFWTTSKIPCMPDLYEYRGWQNYGKSFLANKKGSFYPQTPDDVATSLEEFMEKKPVQALNAMSYIARKHS